MPSNQIGIRELREKLADVLCRLRDGPTFTITSNKAVIAKLRPAAPGAGPVAWKDMDGPRL